VAALWVGISLLTGVAGMPGSGGVQVAWAAHVGGFVLGFAAFDVALIGYRPHRVK
jgi:membrane associated rhomboid family serine protease